jgi:hypothetical protein
VNEDYHTKTIKIDDVRVLTREVMKIHVPTGIGRGNFIVYQMRRSCVDDSGLLLKLFGETVNEDFQILERYSREDEWKSVKWLSSQVFLNLGVRKPEFMWPEDKDKYFQDRIRNTDKDVLIHLKDKIDDESDLGSLFG